MGRLFLSIAGEGRGHATRAATIIDALKERHEIVLFAPGDALELLRPRYRGTAQAVDQLTRANLGEFLDDLNSFKLPDLQRRRVDGTETTLGVIEDQLRGAITAYAAAV